MTTYGYDTLGNRVYQQNPDASTKSWTYDANFNLVTSAVDELGRSRSFSYDATSGNLTSSTDPAGYVTSYTYTTRGQAETVTEPDPDGSGPLTSPVTQYAYDSDGRLTTLTNPDSSTRVYTYDAADNRLTDRDELLNTATWTYDTLGRVTSVTDRTGAETEYVYNGLGQLTQMLDPFDEPTDYTYHSRGWLSTITEPDPDGGGPLTRPVTTYHYTATGKKSSAVDPLFPSGTEITYTYDAADRLDRVDGPWATVYHDYTYDALGRLIRDDDDQLRRSTYEYNSRGWVTKETGPDPDSGGGPLTSPVTLYTYNSAGERTSVTDPRGYTTEYTYNSRGLPSSTIEPDPDGSGPNFAPTTTNEYDNLGRLIGVTDPLGRTVNYAYNSRDWLTSTTEPDPDGAGSLTAPVTTFGYDAAGRKTSVTDPLNRLTTYGHDDEGRVTSVTEPDPDGAGSLTSPVTSYAYNLAGWMTSETDPNGGVTSYGYDALGRRTSVTEADPDGGGPLSAPVTSYQYDDRGLVEKIVDPLSRQTTFQYDEVGRRTSITDHQGNVTSYTYGLSHDRENLLTTTTEPDPDGAGSLESPVTQYAHDALSRVIAVYEPDPDGGGPLGIPTTNYTYDAAGNLLTLKDPVGNTTSWAYDGLGRPTMETNELSQSRSFYHDAADNLTRKVDRNGRVTQFVHDDLDRLTEEQWRTGGTPVPTIAISTTTEGGTADEVQRVGYTIDGSMSTSGSFTLTYDGQTTSSLSWDASAATVQSALEALSNIGSGDVAVEKLQDTMEAQEWRVSFQGSLAETNVVQTTIDTSSISAFGGSPVEIEATDTDGSSGGDETQQVTLSNATDGTFRLAFQGQTSAPVDYDATAATVETALEALNAVDQVTVTGNSGGPWSVAFAGSHSGQNVPQMQGDAATAASGSLARSLAYAYDAAGQLTSTSDPAAAYTFVYDRLGRPTSITHDLADLSSDVEMQASYDAAGNRTQLKSLIGGVDDFVSDYAYDALHRMTGVEQYGVTGGNSVAEKRIDFAYTAAGEWDTITRYADLSGTQLVATSSYVHDTLSRLTDLTHAKGSTTLADYDWTYDNLGRPTQFVSLTDGTADYSYDNTSQLTGGTYDYQSDESHSYDKNGNRTNTGYSTGTNNQLLSDGTYEYTYDHEGNRTSRTEIATGAVDEYSWDHRNRLIKIVKKDGSGTVTKTVEYTYDVFDRRVEKQVSPATGPAEIEHFVYDGEHVALRFKSDQLANRYLHGPSVDQILADEQVDSLTSPGDVLWPLTDNLGTVRDLAEYDGGTDATTVANHITYDAFGGVMSETNAAVDHLFAYTGREWDADADLQYNRARWYDPAVGRWISEDPIGFEAGDVNLFRYVKNAPTVTRDPSGLLEDSTKVAVKDWLMSVVPYFLPGGASEGVSVVQGTPDAVKLYLYNRARGEQLEELAKPTKWQDVDYLKDLYKLREEMAKAWMQIERDAN